MSQSNRQPWLWPVIGLGLTYAAIGVIFALPTGHTKAWRWAAWAVSAGLYAAHICHERFRRRNRPLSAALHVASAAALGALGLAVAANIHSLRLASAGHHHLLLLALGLWPAITALPAFLVAWAASALLSYASPRVK